MSKNRGHRWAYMSAPGYNPPNDDCPECTEPSKTYYVGGKTVGGVPQHRWTCEHKHEWFTRDIPRVRPATG